MIGPAVLDAHVHFWAPGELDYPWLDDLPSLRRPFLPGDFQAARGGAPVQGVIFVECNPRPDQGLREAAWVQSLDLPWIRGIVAFADLSDAAGLGPALDRLADVPKVRGIRHNIQGNPPGFCLRPDFVAGVREVGRRGLTFDLCCTHDQMEEVVELARRCPETRMVLDHCGKPAIREGLREPWRTCIAELAGLDHVWCKLSGLLTEADHAAWREEDLRPYAEWVVECFGTDRLMYGSDWPVLTLAGGYADWYHFTRALTREWSPDEARRFFGDNATRFYRV